MRSEERRSDGGNSADFCSSRLTFSPLPLFLRRVTPLWAHGFSSSRFHASGSRCVRTRGGRTSLLRRDARCARLLDRERACVDPIVVVPTSFDLHATTSAEETEVDVIVAGAE